MKNIPIFLASDDNYAPFLCTTAYSILKNTTSSIDFYVLDSGISNKSKKKINLSLKNFKNYSIKYIDMSVYNLDRFPNLRHYSVSTFSRYFIPEIALDLEKVLYMDVDIIVKKDIADLYNHDLEHYPIAAVLEDFFKMNYTHLKKNYPAYNGNSNYFNAGVLIINLTYFRKHNLTSMLIEKTIELKDMLNCADQDIFNIFFDCNFKILDYKYNFMPDYFDLLKKLHPDRADFIKNNAVVLHYTRGKPWRSESVSDGDFWIILGQTAFHKAFSRIKRTFLEYIFSVYTLERFIEIYIFGIKISIKRKTK